MKNLRSVFNLDDQNKVPIKELRVIMRALDFDLDPDQLEACRKKIDPKGESFIKFANLKPKKQQI